jgi:hypothetical protein
MIDHAPKTRERVQKVHDKLLCSFIKNGGKDDSEFVFRVGESKHKVCESVYLGIIGLNATKTWNDVKTVVTDTLNGVLFSSMGEEAKDEVKLAIKRSRCAIFLFGSFTLFSYLNCLFSFNCFAELFWIVWLFSFYVVVSFEFFVCCCFCFDCLFHSSKCSVVCLGL